MLRDSGVSARHSSISFSLVKHRNSLSEPDLRLKETPIILIHILCAYKCFFFSLSHCLSFFSTSQDRIPITPSYSLIPYTPLTNSSTIQKCHSSSHCHPHFQPSPPSVPFCSWAEKQLKQFSCRELLSLIAMKDTFSHHSLGDFFFSVSFSLSGWKCRHCHRAWAL